MKQCAYQEYDAEDEDEYKVGGEPAAEYVEQDGESFKGEVEEERHWMLRRRRRVRR